MGRGRKIDGEEEEKGWREREIKGGTSRRGENRTTKDPGVREESE